MDLHEAFKRAEQADRERAFNEASAKQNALNLCYACYFEPCRCFQGIGWAEADSAGV